MKRFVCDKCGRIYTGNEAPEKCSKCGAPKARIYEISDTGEVIIDTSMLSLTDIARIEAYYRRFNLDDVEHYLDEDCIVRRIDEVLNDAISKKAQKENATIEKIKSKLKQKLGPQNKQNVSNWLNGKVEITREKAIEIAFSLEMTCEETETFLKRCFFDGFYMRDIKDFIYQYALENHWSYEEANEKIKDYEELDHSNPNPNNNGAVKDNKYTAFLKEKYTSIKNLDNFIKQNKQYFGSYRRTVYERYMKYYNQIKKDFDKEEKSNNYLEKEIKKERNLNPLRDQFVAEKIGIDSTDDIFLMQTHNYTQDTVPLEELWKAIVIRIPEIRQGNTNNIRRLITEHIPIRQDMSEIINQHPHKKDNKVPQVDRKLLILVYLASEKGETKKHTKEKELEKFHEHIGRINSKLLQPLGMAKLDPRHPFDWIIMNMLRCAYRENTTDILYRMNDLVKRMINNKGDK